MGTQERRAREREATRCKILEAARELFSHVGYEAVTMRAIAERIEYSATALYKHFADKESLIRALADEDFLTLRTRFARFAQLPDPLERLHKIGEAYVSFAVAHPNHYRLTFMTPCPPAKDGAECQPSQPGLEVYELVKGCFAQAQRDGRIAAEHSADALAQAAWAALHGVLALHLTIDAKRFPGWRPPKETGRLVMGLLQQGLGFKPRDGQGGTP